MGRELSSPSPSPYRVLRHTGDHGRLRYLHADAQLRHPRRPLVTNTPRTLRNYFGKSTKGYSLAIAADEFIIHSEEGNMARHNSSHCLELGSSQSSSVAGSPEPCGGWERLGVASPGGSTSRRPPLAAL